VIKLQPFAAALTIVVAILTLTDCITAVRRFLKQVLDECAAAEFHAMKDSISQDLMATAWEKGDAAHPGGIIIATEPEHGRY
jgi:hypothetical protein